MKKVVAILLMGLLFFNWYGYRLITDWIGNRAGLQLEARIDNDSYDESQLVTIKVPSTHLSYYNGSAQFEKVNGEIEIAGIQYKYVARRIFNDSLELRCIPNRGAMKMASARDEFFKLVNDIQQHNGQGKKGGGHSDISKTFSSIEFFPQPELYSLMDLHFISLPKAADRRSSIVNSYHTIAEQPPDHFSVC